MPSRNFVVRVEADADAATSIVALEGELDLNCTEDVETALADARAASLVVIDMRKLRFIDSSGIRMLVNADQRSRADGTRLVMYPPPHPVRNVFEITQLDSVLPFEEPSV